MIFGEPIWSRPQHPLPVNQELFERLEAALAEPPILHLYRNRGRGGGHPSYVAILYGGGCAVMKTEDEVQDGLTMIKHERAAWVLACALGFGDLVATTVLRDVPSPRDRSQIVKASLQTVWPNCEAYPAAEPLRAVDQFDLLRAAIFDRVIYATDRSQNNWVTLNGTKPPQLKLIDHGHAFGHQGRGFASDPYTTVKSAGRVQIPEELVEGLKGVLEAWPPAELPDLLGSEKVEGVRQGIVELVEAGEL